MAVLDVSVATVTFLIFFESLEVRGPPIYPSSHHPRASYLTNHHHSHATVRALLPAHCLMRPAR